MFTRHYQVSRDGPILALTFCAVGEFFHGDGGDDDADGADDGSGDQHGADAEVVEDHAADEVGEDAADGDGGGDVCLSFYLIEFLHGLADIVGGGGDEDCVSEELDGLAYVHHGHVAGEDEDQDLSEECKSGEGHQCAGRDLFQYECDEGHDGKFQDSLKEYINQNQK